MTRLLATVLVLAALGVWPAAAVEPAAEVIEPGHRVAQELVPVIEPMLGEGESVQAFDGKLILHARPATLAQVERLLRRIDHPPALLRVTLRLGRQAHEAAGDTSASVRVEGGEDPSAEGRVRVRETRSDVERQVTKQVQVAEGRTASVQLGTSVPVPEHTVGTGPGGTRVHGGIHYRDVSVALTVRPRLVGDRARVELYARDEALDSKGSGAIETQDVATTVSGALGEWLLVGGIADAGTQHDTAILSTRRERFDDARQIWIKVERAE